MANPITSEYDWSPTYFGIELEPVFHATHVEIVDKSSNPLHLYVAVCGAGDRALGYIHFYYESHKKVGGESKKLQLKGHAKGKETTSYCMIYDKQDVNWPELPWHDEPEAQEKQVQRKGPDGKPLYDQDGNPIMDTITEIVMVPKQQDAYDEPKLQSFYAACSDITRSS